jgi:hypothetical protein
MRSSQYFAPEVAWFGCTSPGWKNQTESEPSWISIVWSNEAEGITCQSGQNITTRVEQLTFVTALRRMRAQSWSVGRSKSLISPSRSSREDSTTSRSTSVPSINPAPEEG